MSSDIDLWLTAFQLSRLGELRVIAVPRSERGAGEFVKQRGWPSRIVECMGGKSGMRTEYQLPDGLQNKVKLFIESNPEVFKRKSGSTTSRQRGEPPPSTAHSVREPVTPYGAPDGFILVPRYDIQGSAGHGTLVHSEQVVDYLAFKADWVRNTLGVAQKDLALISVKGDSMEPSLSNDDLILVDMRKNSVEDNAVYVLQLDGTLLVKRIQRKLDGSLHVMSDNPRYEAEVVSVERTADLRVLGRVVWSGRRM